MALQSRGVRTLFMSTLLLSAALSACDQPTEVEPALDPAFAPAPATVADTVPCGTGNKTVRVKVVLSDATNGQGVVVTLISKQDGPQCYGTASADGLVLFTDVAQGAEIFISARDEVNEYVAGLEIIPPDLSSGLDVFDDAPTMPATRQVPTLLSGDDCDVPSALSWANWTAQNADPCVVPGPGFDLTVQMGAPAAVTTLTIQDPDGLGVNAVVAALSPWEFTSTVVGAQADACDYAPWIDPVMCDDPDASSGPALIQSVDITDGTGSVSLGHADTSPIVLEAITERDGLTFFATIDPADAINGVVTAQMAPGMCYIATVNDVMDSSVPNVNIIYTQHSVGMVWPGTIPTAVNNALVVRTEVHATAAGGAGRFDISWQLAGEKNARSARADFVIPANFSGQCPAINWSGSGLSGVGEPADYCALFTDQSLVTDPNRRAYLLYFVVPGVGLNVVGGIKDAWYQVTTVGDGVDPSKSNNKRASISFNYVAAGSPLNGTVLNRESCPVRDNNDGRFGTFRLGNNDGRFGTF